MGGQKHTGKKAVIIGSGIGGLCAAICLRQQGWSTIICEQRQSLAESGAGIVLGANAMHVLGKMGAAERVHIEGAKVGQAEIRTWDGKLLTRLPADEQAAAYGSYSYLIHRAKLKQLLLERLADDSVLHLGKQLVSVEQDADGAAAYFADGTSESCDLLIGADGLHSIVRESLFGRQSLQYSGFTALRGITTYNDPRYAGEKGGGFEAWGPGKRFGFSHLGGHQVFWFAAVNAPEGELAAPGRRREAALRHFAGWYEPVEAVVAATPEADILAHDIFDREPLVRWSAGRVVLLGDAAHPMLPNLGQGGAQAMEDAWVLAQCLGDSAADLSKALLAYESRRIPRTTRIAKQSRRMARMVQAENPLLIALRNTALGRMPGRLQIRQLAGLLGYKV